MREILFRGKRIDNGEWVEGYYLNGKLEGLTWAVEDVDINAGLMEVNSGIEDLLKEDSDAKAD